MTSSPPPELSPSPPAGARAEVLVECTDVVKTYQTSASLLGRRSMRAVDGVSFTVTAGSVMGLVGETGSGKSTTGRLVLGLERPTSGRVVFAGQDLASMSGGDLRRLRRQMQPVAQDPYSALNGRMRVSEILAEPFIVHRTVPKTQIRRHTEELVDLVGLPADSLDRYPHEFSGGQRQRIVIARAIALQPRLIVCDEPLSALDVSVQSQIINLLRRLQAEFSLTYLFISHDLGIVRLLCDTVAVMYLGQLMELASRDALFDAPAHPYTRALLASVPVSDPLERRSRERRPIGGEAERDLTAAPGCPFQARCPLAEEQCRQRRPEWRQIEPGHFVACHLAGPGRPAA
ncbi:MAG: ABC transporter ATP-binding protein [Acidobacteriota bacterium]|nr:ABC transporter ATP-binding protein [Acidobacteriota bacterium]